MAALRAEVTTVADSDTPALGERYVTVFTGGMFAMALVCRNCGALVHPPAAGAEVPTTVDVHNAFHERMDELWTDLRRREEWTAEERERADG